MGRPTVENVVAGFHSTLMAYGQTGAGKTFTMHGHLAQGARGQAAGDQVCD